MLDHYEQNRENIRHRIKQFSNFMHEPVEWHYDGTLQLKESDYKTDERLFHEIVFCILAANTSAVMATKAVQDTRDLLNSAPAEELQKALKKSGCRFHTVRSEYIVWTRHNLEKTFDFRLKKTLEKSSPPKLRELLAEHVKGFGYKEASHFLRNAGIFGLAILDKHVLRGLKEQGVIQWVPKSLTKRKYLVYEKNYLAFADQLNISPEELDLAMWSQKNGRVLK